MSEIRAIVLCLISLLAGLAIGLFLSLSVFDADLPVPTVAIAAETIDGDIASADLTENVASPYSTAPAPDLTGNRVLLARATSALSDLKAKDYASFAALVHPQKGVTFTPYSTVDAEANLNFSASAIAKAGDDGTEYLWGITDGQGAPIQLTMTDYFDAYVFNVDYTLAPMIGVDQVIGSGNSLENVAEAYPGCRFVEFHFPGIEEKNKGFDWCSLKLVFEEYNGDYKLIGVIHSQWTI